MRSGTGRRSTFILWVCLVGLAAMSCSDDENPGGSASNGGAATAGTAGASLGGAVPSAAGSGGIAGSTTNGAGSPAYTPGGTSGTAGSGGAGTAGVTNPGGGIGAAGSGSSPYCFEQIYFDGGVPLGADIWTWSSSKPPNVNCKSIECGTAPEGLECCKTTSADWTGWGVFPETQDSRSPWDLSACTRLTFWAKTDATTTINLKIDIQLTTAQSTKRTRYIPVTPGSWQQYTILRDEFGAANYSSVYGPFLVTVENGSQVFYIDDVQWTSGAGTGGAGGAGNVSGGASGAGAAGVPVIGGAGRTGGGSSIGGSVAGAAGLSGGMSGDGAAGVPFGGAGGTGGSSGGGSTSGGAIASAGRSEVAGATGTGAAGGGV